MDRTNNEDPCGTRTPPSSPRPIAPPNVKEFYHKEKAKRAEERAEERAAERAEERANYVLPSYNK